MNASATPRPSACRFCGAPLRHTFVDLGMSPLCESFLRADELNGMEPFYPLHAYVCEQCFLVQVQEYVAPDRIFTEYAYFSSYAESWLRHARDYVEMIAVRLGLGAHSQVMEVGSNDGYLLQYFVERGIPALGIEPAANVAKAAVEKGVPTLVEMFGRETARSLVSEGRRADLVIGNNVLAQVTDLNGFVDGLAILLKPHGVATLEFPHLLRLMEGNQFDTIYHEHFSYFSFLTVEKIFAAHGLTLFDVEELWTHGGSLRIYARPTADDSRPVSARVNTLRTREVAAGFDRLPCYTSFAGRVVDTKHRLLDALISIKRGGQSIAGYGAPGKGNTLLNYCGIRTDFLDYTVDRNPYKHGRFLPGTHIPVFAPDRIRETKPDYLLILPWNLKDEIVDQMSYIRAWGGRFIVPIPEVAILP
jgi:2-polyprenyl-3-methyl-5-hydroxy-6-metoxy-1,4-benzoquinol methylase